jgi:hypothetical protein
MESLFLCFPVKLTIRGFVDINIAEGGKKKFSIKRNITSAYISLAYIITTV